MIDNKKVRACLVELNYIAEDESIGPDESLFDRNIIDSLGIVSLVALLTSRYGIVVPEEDLLPDHFDSITSIARYVNSRLQSENRSQA